MTDQPTTTPRVHIAVPVFNNHRTVRDVVESVLDYELPVVVVDDGSSDGSGQALDGLDVQIRRHERNRGKGAALMTAARHIAEAGGTHMICYDADGQFDPADLASFIETVRRTPLSVVYGVRGFVEGDAPGLSVFGRSWSNMWARITSGKKILDSQCGFRAYPVQLLLALNIKRSHYDFEVESLVRCIWAGCKPIGVPIAVTYSPPGGRVTHFRLFMDNARITKAYTRLVIRAIMPIPHRVVHTTEATGEEEVLSPWHPIAFLKALLKESSTPAQLAASAALGLFVGTLPIFGLHMIAVVFAAGLLRLNRLLAFSVSHLCAPPLVPALCIEIGYFLRNRKWLSTFTAETLWDQIGDRLIDYVLGTVVMAPVLAVLAGGITYGLARVARTLINRDEEPVASPPGRAVTAKYGTRAGIVFFHIVLKVVGLRGAYFCLWFAVPYYVLFRPSLRRRTDPYLRRRFPEMGRLRRTVAAMRWVMEFSKGMVDEAAVRVLGPQIFSTEVAEVAALQSILDGDRGVILLMTHAGNWRVVIPTLGITEKPVSLLLFQDPSAPTAVHEQSREILGRARIIDPAGAFGGLIEATSSLMRSEIVSIMGDRLWGGRTVAVEFFGERAYLPESPYRLAGSTGTRLVAILVSRVGHRKFHVDCRELPEGPSGNGVAPNRELYARQAQAYMSWVQEFLVEHPYSWSNFFDFWRQHASGTTARSQEPG